MCSPIDRTVSIRRVCASRQPVNIMDKIDSRATRERLGLSVEEFAAALGVSVDILRSVEEGKCEPTGPTLRLLQIAEKHPSVFSEAAPADAWPAGSASVTIDLPPWVTREVDWKRRYASDIDRMRLAIALSRANVMQGTGGPFGAAIFESETGLLVSVGVSSTVRKHNCTLHAEMLAFMLAQNRVKSFSLGTPGIPRHELVTSCEPCAMCLGATLWSGVRRVVCGATREDAMLISFEEGPVFPESYAYLEARGIDIVRGVLRDEARAIITLYAEMNGTIYNG